MKIKKLLFYLLAAILGGCIPIASLHSLYTKSDIIFEEKLLGIWIDDSNSPETIWEFTRMDEPNNAYKMIFTDEDERKGSFVVNLVKLEGNLFLDFYPSELPWEPEDPNKAEWLYNSFFLMPCHTFFKVESIEPKLVFHMTANSEMKKLLQENPDSIGYTTIEDRIVLTGTTKQLQSFILKYIDDERLFPGDIELVRKTD